MPTIDTVTRSHKTREEFYEEAQELKKKGYKINVQLYVKARMKLQEITPVEERDVKVKYPLSNI